jgi:hypothetical protein
MARRFTPWRQPACGPGGVVGQPLQRHGVPCAVPREPGREDPIVLRHPHGRMHVKPGVRPRKHAGGLGQVEELEVHEEPEHGAAKRLGQPRHVMHRPRDERPVGPEPAVGDEEMQVGMPVGARPMGLQAGDDADREVTLTGQRADRGGEGARGDTGDLAEQPTAIQAVRVIRGSSRLAPAAGGQPHPQQQKG